MFPDPPSSSQRHMKLEGITVLDLSIVVPGPHMTMTLADHGAEVVKIEPYPDGDPSRGMLDDDGRAHHGERSELFRKLNRGKKSVRLNLKDVRGRDLLLRMCDRADVLVESFRPGVMERLGLDFKTVSARAPRIVYCSISGFGQSGPYRDRPAHDRAAQAMAASLGVVVGRDGFPAIAESAPAAVMAGSLTALNAVLMALLARHRSGRGDYIDVAMHDALLAWAPQSLERAAAGREAPSDAAAFRSAYETLDGRFIVLGGIEQHFADNLLAKAGRPELAALCRRPPGAAQEPVRRFLRELFLTRTLAQWREWLADIDVAWAPLRTLGEVVRDPATRARGMVVEDERGRLHLGTPIRFEFDPGRADLHCPALGEHTAELLGRIGCTPAEIVSLAAAGVI